MSLAVVVEHELTIIVTVAQVAVVVLLLSSGLMSLVYHQFHILTALVVDMLEMVAGEQQVAPHLLVLIVLLLVDKVDKLMLLTRVDLAEMLLAVI